MASDDVTFYLDYVCLQDISSINFMLDINFKGIILLKSTLISNKFFSSFSNIFNAATSSE